MRKLGFATLQFVLFSLMFFGFVYNYTHAAETKEFNVYQVYRAIDLGETDHAPPKDIFVSIGSDQGVK